MNAKNTQITEKCSVFSKVSSYLSQHLKHDTPLQLPCTNKAKFRRNIVQGLARDHQVKVSDHLVLIFLVVAQGRFDCINSFFSNHAPPPPRKSNSPPSWRPTTIWAIASLFSLAMLWKQNVTEPYLTYIKTLVLACVTLWSSCRDNLSEVHSGNAHVTLQVGKSSTLEKSQRRGAKGEAWVRTGQHRYVVYSVLTKFLSDFL